MAIGDEKLLERHNHFAHIPLHNQRPLRPTLLRLELVQGQKEIELPDLQAIIAGQLENTPQYFKFCTCACDEHSGDQGLPFMTLWSFLDSLDLDKVWAVQLWQLSQRNRPTFPGAGVLSARPTTCLPVIAWDPQSWPPARPRRPLHEQLLPTSTDGHQEPSAVAQGQELHCQSNPDDVGLDVSVNDAHAENPFGDFPDAGHQGLP